MADPMISVIVPCYNGGAFLEACIASVLAPGVACEIIVVDDGSTDDSASIARAYVHRWPDQLLVILQPNQGQAAARNTGLRLARGKYVVFLDVDDEYAPDFFAPALEVLERDNATVAVQG